MAADTETTGPATRPVRTAKGRRIGVVEAVAGKQTVRVHVSTLVRHSLYGKYRRRRTKLLVHDPEQDAKVGDTVEVVPCRPISKRKSWRLLRVVRRATIV